MTVQDFVRAAAGVLAGMALSVGVTAQTQRPQPPTMVDTAPVPAQERDSAGAVILMEQPVLAQREAMKQAQERSVDTRTLGAGPDRIVERVRSSEQQQFVRALEEALKRQGARAK
jgi:hypothetical protein